MTSRSSNGKPPAPADDYAVRLERATRGLLELNIAALEDIERRVGLTPLRALQCLDRNGPSLVGELGDDLCLLPTTASRLSDRLADAGLVTRRPAPANRQSMLLELTDAGRGVLAELVTLRIRTMSAVTGRLSNQDRAALIHGARAFTTAKHAVSDQSRKQRSESRQSGG